MNYEILGFSLARHLDWLQELLDLRMTHYFAGDESAIFEPPSLPELLPEAALDADFARLKMGWAERAIILLGLAPLVRPQMLDVFFVDNPNLKRGFTEFGGLRGKDHGGFLPTAETAVFLVAGNDLTVRLELMRCFQPDHFFYREYLLDRSEPARGEPALSALLNLTPSAIHRYLWDETHRPDFNPSFPASRVTTSLTWDDLVLSPTIMEQVLEIKSWMENEPLIREEWGLGRILKPGFRVLFHGPPGTGKTLTAALLGQALDLDVYRIDLSMVVSKYIGETEKNLSTVFDQAEKRRWLLFFDEADALFGKRTTTQSSNDRYANQEVSYLLQRVEDFGGPIVLASNFKGNMDDAFIRRFQSMINFAMPNADQRRQLWNNAFSHGLGLSEECDLDAISEDHELSGGEIVNVVRTLAIRTARRGDRLVTPADFREAIRKEYEKEGRILSGGVV